MRKRRAVKRDVLPDPIYKSKTVAKLTNTIMLDGKKGTAQTILYEAFDMVKEKTGRDPLEVFNEAILVEAKDNRDGLKNAALMNALKEKGEYEITPEMREKLTDFVGGYASEEECFAMIKALYDEFGYVIDTHTAVAAAAYKKYRKETNDQTKTIIASTASPYKFTRSVMKAIDRKYDSMEDFALVDELSKLSNTSVPKAIEEIRTAPVLHDTVCEKDEMKEVVKKFLGI